MRKPLSIADRLVTRIESPHIVWADKKRTIPEEVVITVWLARYLYPTFWFLVGSIKANKKEINKRVKDNLLADTGLEVHQISKEELRLKDILLRKNLTMDYIFSLDRESQDAQAMESEQSEEC